MQHVLRQISAQGGYVTDCDRKQILMTCPGLNQFVNYNTKTSRDSNIFVGYLTPLHIQWLKAERELYKQTTRYKLYKAHQAVRILVKLCIREWFKTS